MIPGKIRIVTWCATIALGSLCLGSVYDDLAPVRERMQAWVESQEIAGAVTAVADAQRVLRLDAVGYRDVASQTRLQENDLFWIASMTKPMVAVCILMLQEQGLLSVDDSVEKYLPEFKQQWILQEQDNERRVLVPATTPITLRHLLTHSSGLADVPTPRSNSTLAELVMAYAREPLRFPPGDRWSYSNSGINTLGRIIEVVSGQTFVGFLEQRLLRPLRMVDTTFWPTPAQATRLAQSYRRAESGHLEEVPV